MRKIRLDFISILGSVILALGTSSASSDTLGDGFRNPPNVARPKVYWPWMNGNITEEGIRRDLEWMKRVGIGGLQHFDAQIFTPKVVEKRLSYMTPEWQQAFRYAVTLSDRLDLEFGILSSPGWSHSGGPWVKPEQGIKKLVWSETILEGGRRFQGILAMPPSRTGPFQDATQQDLLATNTKQPDPQFYADTIVVAYRPPDMGSRLPTAKVSSSSGTIRAPLLSDGRQSTFVAIPAATEDASAWLRIDYATPRTIRSAMLGLKNQPTIDTPALRAHLEAGEDGVNFRPIAMFPEGGVPQYTISFKPVTARSFRVRFEPLGRTDLSTFWDSVPGAAIFNPFPTSENRSTIRITEFTLHNDARIHRFEEKAGFGVVPDYYALATPSAVEARSIAPSDVVDLTGRMSVDGRIDWTPPPGRWKVLRFGYSLTGKKNHPATVEATGLEVDKLDRAAVKSYIERYLDSFEQTTGPALLGKRGVTMLLQDSIEVGPMNWTADMIAQFRRLRGYDPVPWFPALTGTIIGSPAQSDAFLFDFRRTLADLFVENHYGQIAQSAHARGLVTYAEALEFGRPSLGDDMAMRRYADLPMGAMWVYRPEVGPRPAYVADIRGAASVAHVYGQNLVAAEALTSGYSPWAWAPADLKPIIDLEFALGVNQPAPGITAHQPIEKKPGLTLSIWGTHFHRHETWAEQAKPWIDYLSRSAFMLQQGRFSGDVAYFYGEEAPLTGLFENKAIADAPEGHGYDFVNADVVLNQFKVEDGALATPSGMRYRLLYLGGSSERMTLPVLRKIAELVAAGATLAGNRPSGSPSLADDPAEFVRVSERLWGSAGGRVGKGRVIPGLDVNAALRLIGLARDFDYAKPQPDSELMFVHRTLKEGDVYFVTNRKPRAERIEASFRVSGRRPEIWRATSGTSEPVSFHIEKGRTIVPFDMTANDAFFVVFRDPTTQSTETVAKPAMKTLAALDGPWTVTFETGRGAPAEARFGHLMSFAEHPEPGIRYFSGTASYRKSFNLPQDATQAGKLWLDLGKVGDIAEVIINGQSVATHWLALISATR